MLLQFHGVIKHPANPDDIRVQSPIDHEMPGALHDPGGMSGTIAAMAEMVAPDSCPDFGPFHASHSVGIKSDILKRDGQQQLVSQARNRAEVLVG